MRGRARLIGPLSRCGMGGPGQAAGPPGRVQASAGHPRLLRTVIDDLGRRWVRETRLSRIIGIDLGRPTASSPTSTTRRDCRASFPDGEGRKLLPSVVAFRGPRASSWARPARRQLVRRPHSTVYSVKRFMGRDYEDVKDELRYFPFAIRPADGIVKLDVGGRRGHAARGVGRRAESLKGGRGAFKEPSRRRSSPPRLLQRHSAAGHSRCRRIAGLDVVRIVNEPTAAALAYASPFVRGRDRRIRPWAADVDISILRSRTGSSRSWPPTATRIWAATTSTASSCCGCSKTSSAAPRGDRRSGLDLARDARRCKELRLAAGGREDPVFHRGTDAAHDPFAGFTYARRARGPTSSASSSHWWPEPSSRAAARCRCRLRREQIDQVASSGGSTRVPLVRRRWRSLRAHAAQPLDPDEVSRSAAAVQARILAGGITDMLCWTSRRCRSHRDGWAESVTS